MGLGITVGRLAYFLEDDYAEGVEEIERDLVAVNRLLAENGLPTHTEPRTRPEMHSRSDLDHMPYTWYGGIQRAVAFSLHARKRLPPLKEGEDAWKHPLVLAEEKQRRSHIICHSGAEGYYVPIDFPNPLFVDLKVLAGGSLGSCQAVMRELVAVAPLLSISLDGEKLPDAVAQAINEEGKSSEPEPLWEEREAWLVLFEAFRLSLEHGLAVSFH